ncbi:hypothetical protein SCLCIDRAFT_930765 [Scleroderma citrinum Foug A]|uniref:Uncharacterized protein n=1 Tax=Scleroderma citrinum Foug A TaxID=1036808 RepID=A0A0C2ZGM7_9AGAM|nr:hypothetical protein SCLCIDRAFT_930765 [Scleroderma citrinum Foug A]
MTGTEAEVGPVSVIENENAKIRGKILEVEFEGYPILSNPNSPHQPDLEHQIDARMKEFAIRSPDSPLFLAWHGGRQLVVFVPSFVYYPYHADSRPPFQSCIPEPCPRRRTELPPIIPLPSYVLCYALVAPCLDYNVSEFGCKPHWYDR